MSAPTASGAVTLPSSSGSQHHPPFDPAVAEAAVVAGASVVIHEHPQAGGEEGKHQDQSAASYVQHQHPNFDPAAAAASAAAIAAAAASAALEQHQQAGGREEAGGGRDKKKSMTEQSPDPAVEAAVAVSLSMQRQEQARVHQHQVQPQQEGANGGGSGGGIKKKRREWLNWHRTKTITEMAAPPYGLPKPAPMTEHERSIIANECRSLFPIGFYEMSCKKRGVTKGRGQWRGKEALRLLHCTSERAGCKFKARFCRIVHGMELWTSGEHDFASHSAPPKRGLPPDARAFVTKHHTVGQKELVQALRERGLIENDADMNKVRQQVKRRKLTVKDHDEQEKLSAAAYSAKGEPLPGHGSTPIIIHPGVAGAGGMISGVVKVDAIGTGAGNVGNTDVTVGGFVRAVQPPPAIMSVQVPLSGVVPPYQNRAVEGATIHHSNTVVPTSGAHAGIGDPVGSQAETSFFPGGDATPNPLANNPASRVVGI